MTREEATRRNTMPNELHSHIRAKATVKHG